MFNSIKNKAKEIKATIRLAQKPTIPVKVNKAYGCTSISLFNHDALTPNTVTVGIVTDMTKCEITSVSIPVPSFVPNNLILLRKKQVVKTLGTIGAVLVTGMTAYNKAK